MSDPLPTAKELEALARSFGWKDTEDARLNPLLTVWQPLRAAQHAATRKAVLEEVRNVWYGRYSDASFLLWLDTKLGGSHE